MTTRRLALFALTTIFAALPWVAFAGPQESSWASWFGIGTFGEFVSWAMNLLMSMFSWFTWLGAVVLNFTIQKSVLEMSTWVNNQAIYTAWSTFRDLANISVIFVLLVIGISTILQVERYGAKQLLARVIIVAIFINFSIFMTKAVIDVGNIVALRFYDAIASDNPASADGGIAQHMMKIMNLQTLYSTSLNSNLGTNSATAVSQAFPPENAAFATHNIILISFAGIILFIITGFVFFGMAIALIHRFVTLTLLIIFSSAAFAAAILPKTQPLWDMWLKKLIENTFYAPVFMMMIWVSFLVLGELPKVVGTEAKLSAITYGSKGDAGAAAIFTILIVCALMIASLMGAQKLGLAGSTTAMNSLKGIRNTAGRYAGRAAGAATLGATGALGRYTVGRWANNAAENMKGSRFSRTWTGKQVMQATRKVADASFDARNPISKGLTTLGIKGVDIGKGVKGGFVTRNENFAKEQKKYADSLEPNAAKKAALDEEFKAAKIAADDYAQSVHDHAQKALRDIEGEYEKLKTRKSALEAAYQRAKDRGDTGEMRKLDIDLRQITDDFTKADALLAKRKLDFEPIAKTHAELQKTLKESEERIKNHAESHKAEYIKELEKTVAKHDNLAEWTNDTFAEIIYGKTRRLEAIEAIKKKKDPIKELSEQLSKISKPDAPAA